VVDEKTVLIVLVVVKFMLLHNKFLFLNDRFEYFNKIHWNNENSTCNLRHKSTINT
jgi:hypothetical protein